MGEGMESWQNTSKGRVLIRRFDARRGMLGSELVAGGRTFHITPEDRRINQEMAATAELDIFTNGLLHPVRLIESEEDAKELAANPNLMSETEMKAMFGLHHKQFPKRLGELTNVNALTRLLELALDEDSKATHKQVELIKERLRVIDPGLFVDDRPEPALDRLGQPVARTLGREPAPRAVTPL